MGTYFVQCHCFTSTSTFRRRSFASLNIRYQHSLRGACQKDTLPLCLGMAPATAEDPIPNATSSPGTLTATAEQEDELESGETTSSSSSPHARGSPSILPETQAPPATTDTAAHSAPPLPDEPLPPPLPDESVPEKQTVPTNTASDDGWEPVWDATAGTYYFYNRFTQASQWENPRVPNAVGATPANQTVATDSSAGGELHPAVLGGYNPAIHSTLR